MLKNHRNTPQANSGQPQPLQWADCHIPHIDTVYLGTRSVSERRALPANSGNGQPPAASLIRPSAPWSLGPSIPDFLIPTPCSLFPASAPPSPPKVTTPPPPTPTDRAPLAPSISPLLLCGQRRAYAMCAEIACISMIPHHILVFIFAAIPLIKPRQPRTTLPSTGNHPRLRIRSRI